MKHILIVLEDMSLSGSTLTMLHVVKAMQGIAAFDVLVCTSQKSANQERLNEYLNLCSKIEFGNLPHSMSAKFKTFYSFYLNKIKQLVKKMFNSTKYDYVIGHNYFTNGRLFEYISLALKARPIFYSLGRVSSVSKQKIVRKKELESRELISKYCWKFLSISSNTLDELFESKDKVVFIHDYPSIGCKTEDKIFSPKGEIVVGQIGYFDNNKNQLYSLRLVDLLRKSGISSKIKFLGFKSTIIPEYFNDIEKFIKNNQLDNCVSLYQSDFNIITFFDSIDVLLLPSFSEGYGLTVLESLCRKTPVICSSAIPNEICFDGVYKRSLSNIDEWADLLKSEQYKKNIVFSGEKLELEFVDKLKEILC